MTSTPKPFFKCDFKTNIISLAKLELKYQHKCTVHKNGGSGYHNVVQEKGYLLDAHKMCRR